MKVVRIPSSKLKRVLALALGPALWVLALDAGVSHLAGRGEPYLAQWVPIYFGAAAGLLLWLGVWRLEDKALERLLRGTGVLSAVVGAAGMYFHARVLFRDLQSASTPGLALLGEALAVAPPLLAPMAFIGVGAFLATVGLRGVRLSYQGPLPSAVSPRSQARHRVKPLPSRMEAENAAGSRSDVA